MSHLKQKYKTEIVPALFKSLNLKSVMQVPRLEKIVINMGVGDGAADAKLLEAAVAELTIITNQKPVTTKAKKSIASYKIREGQAIGAKVTLRNANMWAFAEKLFNIALPRVRDFRGFSPSGFDGRGNFTLGIKEQTIFSEINYDLVKKIRGMDVTFVTSTNSDDQAYDLLLALGLPFIKKQKKEAN
ncbi:large subunit ribosomal protein L5 [Mycoplasmoides fastidiosum]|uniref:Large ribosomal subunit protein uL5 n=1 Tax=Mycoplasmoides fastidiosum TaxID=92758 RepID=A0ABU0LY30_9BACT|nr:50S ribosomal protein L5 [Mycoplasmoides fastidiosum]MDQ0513622.1 large subunit ribosomal protein L5 [Mycoplasmoides fastidiosum]